MDAPSNEKTDTNQSEVPDQQPPSSSDLFSSAKIVAGAAQATFSHQQDKVDKTEVAGAAGDLLGAASQYGNLGNTGFGKYVEKAGTYLDQYGSSDSSTTAPAAAASDEDTTGGTTTQAPSQKSGDHDSSTTAPAAVASADDTTGGTTTQAPSKTSGDDADSGGGYGDDIIKTAEGFMISCRGATPPAPSKSGGDDGDSGSGPADYLKMATGFLKKK